MIAKEQGVAIPVDVSFVEAAPGALVGSLNDLLSGGQMETARGPQMYSHADGYIYWNEHFNKFGKIMFQLHPDVLTSDEAIVAAIQHEMFELAKLRQVFLLSPKQGLRMNADDYGSQVLPGKPGNFHDLAWDAADEVILKMRQAKQ